MAIGRKFFFDLFDQKRADRLDSKEDPIRLEGPRALAVPLEVAESDRPDAGPG
jgi:hypothetical protein